MSVPLASLGTRAHLRARSTLRTIRAWCDEMAQQETQSSDFHTVIALDPDVVYMGAFPVENLAMGSVFHDYSYLRNAAVQVKRATEAGSHAARNEALVRIFGETSLRVPLLTTIALSSFIFDRRLRNEPFQAYALLQPHANEWERAQLRGRDDAQRMHHALKKHVNLDDISKIVERAHAQGLDVAEQLIDELPETASALFPAQLAPDHAFGCLFRWKLGGVVKPYERFEGLPRFARGREAPQEHDSAQKFLALFEADLKSALASASASGRLAQADLKRELDGMRPTLKNDADVMTFLKAVHDERPTIRLRGREPRPLRVILLTASARMWRVARRTGLAATCLRSPIAYLGDGSFFDWAFEGMSLASEEENQLLQRLRKGMLSQWLTSLTEAPDADELVTEAHEHSVRQWERLMSNMATSLSLASPTGELRDAIVQVAGGEQASPEQIAALLQHKIVDAANRLTQYASGAGLASLSRTDATLRNLPPVDLREYPPVQALLLKIANADLANDQLRLSLLKEVMALRVIDTKPELAERVAAYSRSVLISLLWFRLQHWESSNEVAGQAAAYALQRAWGEVSEQDSAENLTVRGEEALYLVAVTSRLCARSQKDLELPRMALDLLDGIEVGSERALRTQAERQSWLVADLLLGPQDEIRASMSALSQYRLEKLLQGAIDMMMSPPWRDVTTQALQAGTDLGDIGNQAYGTYICRYALQQLHCAIGIFHLLAAEARVDLGERRSDIALIAAEFERTASHPLDPTGGGIGVVDSRVAQPIRQLMQWSLRRQSGEVNDAADDVLAAHMEQLRMTCQSTSNPLSPLDQLRLERLVRFYDGQRSSGA